MWLMSVLRFGSRGEPKESTYTTEVRPTVINRDGLVWISTGTIGHEHHLALPLNRFVSIELENRPDTMTGTLETTDPTKLFGKGAMWADANSQSDDAWRVGKIAATAGEYSLTIHLDEEGHSFFVGDTVLLQKVAE